MMLLSLLVLIGNFIVTQFIELSDFLLLLYYTVKVMHESLLFDPVFAMLQFLQVLNSPVVGLSSIAIDVLPVLGSLLCIIVFTLNRVQIPYNFTICFCSVHASVELLVL